MQRFKILVKFDCYVYNPKGDTLQISDGFSWIRRFTFVKNHQIIKDKNNKHYVKYSLLRVFFNFAR